MKVIKKFLVSLAILYLLLCTLIYFVPSLFFYKPSNSPSNLEYARENGYMAELVNYEASDATKLEGWYTKPTTKKKVVLFLHGNAYNMSMFYLKIKPLADAGYGTFIAEYRGFGGVKGSIREDNLQEDAKAAVEYLHSLGYENKDIVIYGMSLGSHMAIDTVYRMQSKGNFAGLILEVPFDSLLNVVKETVHFYIPDFVIVDKYNNMDMIKGVKTRILILAGTDDVVTPLVLAQKLFDVAPEPKEMIVYKGAKHDNLFYFGNDKDIINWLGNEKN